MKACQDNFRNLSLEDQLTHLESLIEIMVDQQKLKKIQARLAELKKTSP